jgi:hypothetical protein
LPTQHIAATRLASLDGCGYVADQPYWQEIAMRRIAQFLILMAFGVAANRADAELRCVPEAIDLGEVRGGPSRQQHFELVNDGANAVEIVDVERGCGCLQPRLDRRTLAPGEMAVLEVALRTNGQPNGPRSWNLRLRYRDGDAVREQLLVLSATIRNEVTVQPSILAVEVRDVLRREVIVTDSRSPPLKVTAVESTSPAVRATVQSSASGVTKLSLEVSGAGIGPARQDALVNIYTDDPLYSPLQLPVALSRAGSLAVAVTPPQVEARVSAVQPVSATLVRLRSADGQRVVVASADADDPGVTCTWASGPGNGATLKVQVDRRNLSDRVGPRMVRVRLADPSPEVLTVPVLIEN